MNGLGLIRRNQAVFPLALLAALAMLFISESAYWRSFGTLELLVAEREGRAKVLDLRQQILDAEASQNAFLLTGNADYRAGYERTLAPTLALLDALDAHYRGNAKADTLLVALDAGIKARQALIAERMQQTNDGKPDLAAQFLHSAADAVHVNELHRLGNALLELGTMSVAASRMNINDALQLGRIGVLVLTAVCLLALVLYLRHAAASEAVQRELKQAIQNERDQLEVVVARRTELLTSLTQHLQTAREDERSRLARNLHDELGALLTSAKLDAARMKSRLIGGTPEVLERLAHLVETLNASIALGRSIIEDLRPSTLANLGLPSALDILAREYAERSGVEVHRALATVKLRPSAELMVYRLVQEAVTNITKYAKAQAVWVTLAARDGSVEVTVRDNGVGFDTSVPTSSAYGLVGMRFRVEAEGGALTVVSAPGQGTSVQVRMPESA